MRKKVILYSDYSKEFVIFAPYLSIFHKSTHYMLQLHIGEAVPDYSDYSDYSEYSEYSDYSDILTDNYKKRHET